MVASCCGGVLLEKGLMPSEDRWHNEEGGLSGNAIQHLSETISLSTTGASSRTMILSIPPKLYLNNLKISK